NAAAFCRSRPTVYIASVHVKRLEVRWPASERNSAFRSWMIHLNNKQISERGKQLTRSGAHPLSQESFLHTRSESFLEQFVDRKTGQELKSTLHYNPPVYPGAQQVR